RRSNRPAAGIALDHSCAEFRELCLNDWGTGVMWRDPAMFGRETKRERHLEISQRAHLPIKPGVGLRPKTISPAQTSAHIFDSKLAQVPDCFIQAVILKMKPLANTEVRRELWKQMEGAFWFSILPQQTHMK